jgi:hypothetical protein
MNGIRRTCLLISLTVAVLLGTQVAAHAAFSDSVTTPPVTITTTTVQPVGALSTVGSICRGDTLDLRLSWTQSPTARVSGHRVRMYTNAGFNWNLGSVSAGTTGFAASVSVRVNNQPTTYQFTVTSTTDYGWSTESTRTGAITC